MVMMMIFIIILTIWIEILTMPMMMIKIFFIIIFITIILFLSPPLLKQLSDVLEIELTFNTVKVSVSWLDSNATFSYTTTTLCNST